MKTNLEKIKDLTVEITLQKLDDRLDSLSMEELRIELEAHLLKQIQKEFNLTDIQMHYAVLNHNIKTKNKK